MEFACWFSFILSLVLDEVSHVLGHLLDHRVVKLLNVFKSALILGCHKVDGNTLPTETTTSTDPEQREHLEPISNSKDFISSPVNVVFTV